ncbi:AEC family transporter [Alkalisalibacterium limincola]|uniref:AEC family transporter n=1 Tax=Alkalisalibacterium limincola TaxID=2699169 RepID=A0A5C8KMB3_9GAMM|nr:AEC family transporter [Alkalisalibacterium limincola]TXK60745.1 AEC family transporter [Alkalisalibacterium limincola]
MAIDAFALILAMLALGMVFQRLGVFGADAAEVLNKVVLYVCLPAAILLHAPQLELAWSVLAVVAVPWLLLAATVLLVGLASKAFGFSRAQHAVLLLTVALGNTSFLGYPLIQALLGEQALPYAVIYDQFGSFIILSTFGLYVLARYGGDREPTVREMALRIVKFPPLLTLVFALTLMPAEPPSWIAGGLQRLADALLPLVVLAIGLTIRLRMPREELRPLAVGLGLKLVLMPLLALALAWPLGLSGIAAQATVLEAAMPPMITAAALAISHRLAPQLAAAMVGYGILLSLVSLPLWSRGLMALLG